MWMTTLPTSAGSQIDPPVPRMLQEQKPSHEQIYFMASYFFQYFIQRCIKPFFLPPDTITDHFLYAGALCVPNCLLPMEPYGLKTITVIPHDRWGDLDLRGKTDHEASQPLTSQTGIQTKEPGSRIKLFATLCNIFCLPEAAPGLISDLLASALGCFEQVSAQWGPKSVGLYNLAKDTRVLTCALWGLQSLVRTALSHALFIFTDTRLWGSGPVSMNGSLWRWR